MNRQTILRDAEKLVRQGKPDRAIEEYLRVVEDQPGDWTTANIIGDLYVRTGQAERAVEQFLRIADALAADGFAPKASALVTKALKIDPRHEGALLKAAAMAREQGRSLDAQSYLQRVADERRGHGDARGAAEITIQLAELAPASAESRRLAIRSRVQLGDSDGAVSELLALAGDLAAQGQIDAAVAAWTEAAGMDPGHVALSDEGVAACAAAVGRRRPDEGYAMLRVPVDRAVAGQHWALAADLLDTFVSAAPGHIPAHLRLVDVLVDGRLSRRLHGAQGRLADAYLDAGQAAEARFLAEDLMMAEPDEAAHAERHRRALALLGETPDPAAAPHVIDFDFSLLDDWIGTPDQTGAVVDSQPSPRATPLLEPELTPSLDDVFAGFRKDAGRSALDAAADEDFARGETLLAEGSPDQAVAAFESAARVPRLRFSAASRLGRIYRGLGWVAEAIEWFERAAEAPSPTLEEGHALLYELADALESVGETARALAIYLELRTHAGAYRDVTGRIDRLANLETRG